MVKARLLSVDAAAITSLSPQWLPQHSAMYGRYLHGHMPVCMHLLLLKL